MDRPEGVEIEFLVCENDEVSRVSDVVEAFRAAVSEPVQLMLEPRKGIPFARNRVLAAALEQGFDFLTFVDDDEIVRPDWLVRMLAAVEKRRLDLAAGPVPPIAPPERLTRLQKMVLQELQKRFRAGEQARARTGRADEGADVEAFTGNWCLRLAAARRMGVIRFDETTAESGGEDSVFSRDMRAAGARIGWVPEAVAEEVQPAMRLTLSYIYRRNRDHQMNKMMMNGRPVAKRLSFLAKRSLEVVVLALLLPVFLVVRPANRGKLVFSAARKAGKIAGAFGNLLGRRSRHYAASADRLHVEKGN